MNSTGSRRGQRDAGTQPDGAPRRRADAERNIAAILDAAATCLTQQPQVSMAEVARAAGVGRVTLYAHFPSREALIDAVLSRTLSEVANALGGSDADDVPADQALRRLVQSSWQALDRHRRLFEVAQRELDPGRLREHHDPAMSRIEKLLVRGRDEGRFGIDLPLDWQVTAVYTLLHAAAQDVNAGRLPQDDAGRVLELTVMAVLAAPAPIPGSGGR